MLLVANFTSSVCAIVGPTPRSIETSLAGHVLDVVCFASVALLLFRSLALSLLMLAVQGLDGADVVAENVRQLCAFQLATSLGKQERWWA